MTYNDSFLLTIPHMGNFKQLHTLWGGEHFDFTMEILPCLLGILQGIVRSGQPHSATEWFATIFSALSVVDCAPPTLAYRPYRVKQLTIFSGTLCSCTFVNLSLNYSTSTKYSIFDDYMVAIIFHKLSLITCLLQAQSL